MIVDWSWRNAGAGKSVGLQDSVLAEAGMVAAFAGAWGREEITGLK